MEKSLKVNIVAESAEERFDGEFLVYETYHPEDDGNGMYLIILHKDDLWKCIDARYWVEYDFKRVVDEVFKHYYGDNLKEIIITEIL